MDGVSLHWAELGAGSPIVLLHGLCDSHLTWREIAPALAAAGYRVLLPDLPGHGLSGRPDASYAIDWHARVLGRWIDGLALGRFTLVGHSYGGGLAQQLLLSHGDQVAALALVAPGGFGREVTVAVRALALPGIDRLVQPLFQLGTRLTLRLLRRSFRDPEHRAWQSWLVGAPGTARAVARTARDVVGFGGQTRALEGRLAELATLPPTAVYWGRRDRVLPASHAAFAAQHLPSAQVRLFERCGHFPHLERPAAFSEALLAFLASALLAPIVEARPDPPASRGLPTWLRGAWTWIRSLMRRRPRSARARVAEPAAHLGLAFRGEQAPPAPAAPQRSLPPHRR